MADEIHTTGESDDTMHTTAVIEQEPRRGGRGRDSRHPGGACPLRHHRFAVFWDLTDGDPVLPRRRCRRLATQLEKRWMGRKVPAPRHLLTAPSREAGDDGRFLVAPIRLLSASGCADQIELPRTQ